MTENTIPSLEETEAKLQAIQEEKSRLNAIEQSILEEENQKKELELAAQFAEWCNEESELVAKLTEIREKIKSHKNGGKVKKVKTSDPNAPKRNKGKGFGGVNVEELILSAMSPEGTKMKQIVETIKNNTSYEGNLNSIPARVSAVITKLVKDGKVQKLPAYGVYAPVSANTVSVSTDVETPDLVEV